MTRFDGFLCMSSETQQKIREARCVYTARKKGENKCLTDELRSTFMDQLGSNSKSYGHQVGVLRTGVVEETQKMVVVEPNIVIRVEDTRQMTVGLVVENKTVGVEVQSTPVVVEHRLVEEVEQRIPVVVGQRTPVVVEQRTPVVVEQQTLVVEQHMIVEELRPELGMVEEQGLDRVEGQGLQIKRRFLSRAK